VKVKERGWDAAKIFRFAAANDWLKFLFYRDRFQTGEPPTQKMAASLSA